MDTSNVAWALFLQPARPAANWRTECLAVLPILDFYSMPSGPWCVNGGSSGYVTTRLVQLPRPLF
eukprot:2456523-Amphidinium_carterae.1